MITLTTAQKSFFTANGYLELEGLFSPEECAEFRAVLSPGRDRWRSTPLLKKLALSRQMAHLVCLLTKQDMARLACDHYYAPGYSLPAHEKLKDLLCIQGISLICFIQFESGIPPKTSELGISPYPKSEGNILLVSPKVLLHWPAGPGLYMIAYAVPQAIYINNPKDPEKLSLKKQGYGYGETLRNDTHPVIKGQ